MIGQQSRHLAEASPDLRKAEPAQSNIQWRQALLKLQLSRDSHLAADCYRRCSALLSHLVESKLVTSVEEAAMRVEIKSAWVAAVERVDQPDSVSIRQEDPDSCGVNVATHLSDN